MELDHVVMSAHPKMPCTAVFFHWLQELPVQAATSNEKCLQFVSMEKTVNNCIFDGGCACVSRCMCVAQLDTDVDFPKVCYFPIIPDTFKHINQCRFSTLAHHPNSAQSSNITFARDI